MSVKAEKLEFGYKTTRVVHGCSVAFEKGKVHCLLGPNGSGKTTILNLLNGTLKPNFGTVEVEGRDIRRIGKKGLARLIAMLPQEHRGVFPYTVLDMVVMGRNPHLGLFARPKRQDYLIAEAALETIGILHLRDKCYMEISGGERQMVFIARSIAQEAAYFIMDEPTAHLDFFNQHKILEILRRVVAERGCCVIMAMHDPNLTLMYCDQVVVLKAGNILFKGPVKSVMNEANLRQLYENLVVKATNAGFPIIMPENAVVRC